VLSQANYNYVQPEQSTILALPLLIDKLFIHAQIHFPKLVTFFSDYICIIVWNIKKKKICNVLYRQIACMGKAHFPQLVSWHNTHTTSSKRKFSRCLQALGFFSEESLSRFELLQQS